MSVNPKVFKAYDVRGLCPQDINEELAYLVGKAFVTKFNLKNIVVGIDMRESSTSLYKELARGITDMGCDVTYIGMVPTPVLNFSVVNYKFDGGIIVSASHSPSQYNAFKLIVYPALQVGANSGMEEIKELALKNNFIDAETKGIISQKNVIDNYSSHIKKHCKSLKNLNIVCDYGNGVGAISAKPVFDSLPITVKHLYDKPDGSFPNHEANPHELDNFTDLINEVKSNSANVGIFFDGDADRSFLVDEKGTVQFPDVILGIVTKYRLQNYDDKRVYYDLRFSKAMKEIVEEYKGNPVMMRVGNPFYKEKLQKDGGAFGGELSGHLMFSDNFSIDDGLFASIILLDIMAETGLSLSELAKPMKKYSQSPEINTKVDDADVVMKEAKDLFSDGKFTDIDGVYIEYDDWWFNLRKSNTEPLVRLRVEANTPELLKEKQDKIMELINSHRV